MAALQTLMEGEGSKKVKDMRALKARSRLVADPRVSVGQLADCLRGHLAFKNSKDAFSLVSPVGVTSWKSRPDPNWLVKLAGLHFDLLGLHPNTKVAGKKMRRAILILIESGEVVNSTTKTVSDLAVVQTCIVLAWPRLEYMTCVVLAWPCLEYT